MASMIGTAGRTRASSAYTRGALFGLAAVSIWAGNIVVAGVGLRSSLTPWDISAIRFGVAGLLLLPLLLCVGLAFERLGWIGLAALVLGGAPTVVLANYGLVFAPAAHGGALFPGVMPVMVAMLAAVILKEPFTAQKRVGFALIVTAVIGIVWGTGGIIGTTQNVGHLLFLGSAFSWACYTVAMRKARLDGLHAAAISAVGSLLVYLPPYVFLAGATVLEASPGAIALQTVVQGAADGGHFVCAVRERGQHPGCIQRSGVRGPMSGDDRGHGDTHPRPVALGARLASRRGDLAGSLCRQRWAVAGTTSVSRPCKPFVRPATTCQVVEMSMARRDCVPAQDVEKDGRFQAFHRP